MTRQITINKTETEGFAARIQNRGQSNGTQTVELYKDGVLVTDEANLTLTPDETAYVLEAPTVFSNNSFGDIITMDVITDNMTRTVEVYIGGVPDSVVERPTDNGQFTTNGRFGIRIKTSDSWSDIGAEISSNSSGINTAEIWDVSDGTLMGSADISSLSSGDTFTFGLENPLQPNSEYNVVPYAGGSNMTIGTHDNSTFPYVSEDGNLEIVSSAFNQTSTANDGAHVFRRIGRVGFN